MTEEAAQPEADEIEWIPVVRWPEEARSLVADIEKVKYVLAQMDGTADDLACQVFVNFLRAVLLGRQQELALTMLTRHGIELPEPGTMQTPQERMSAGLAHIADEVRKSRPDLVPEHQPFTARSKGQPPRT